MKNAFIDCSNGEIMGKNTSSLRLSIFASGLMLAGTVNAQSAVYSLDIPAQALDKSLNALAAQTGSRILFATDVAEGRQASALHAQLSVEQALERIVGNTGLVAQKTADGSYLIAAPHQGDALELGATTIQGAGLGINTEDTRSYTTGAVSIGKSERPLKDIPQSITVLTAQRIKDQNIQTLDDVYNVLPGVITYGYMVGDNQPYARGYQIDNYQINGIPLPNSNSITSQNWADLVPYERVEFLKGSAGLFQGAGSPGGAINLVRKRASADFHLGTTTSAGRWDNYQQQVDVQGPLNEDKSVRGRLVTSYGDRGYFYDNAKTERSSTYGVLEFDLSPQTLISTGFSYQNVNNRGVMDFGLPAYKTGANIDWKRSTNLSSPSDYNDVETTQVFLEAKHQLNDDWRMSLTTNYTKMNLDTIYSNTGGLIDPLTHGGGYNWAESRSENNYQYNTDAYLNGHFELFERRHEVILGANATHAKRDSGRYDTQWYAETENIPNILEFIPPEYDRLARYRTVKSTLDQQGVYGSLRMNVLDPLDVIIGARVSWWDYSQDQIAEPSGVSKPTGQKTNAKVVPFYGLVYELTHNWSAYASYAEIFSPQTDYMTYAGNTLAPRSGETYELGLKGEFYEGALNTSFAIYQTNFNGRAQIDQSFPSPCFSPYTTFCYIAGGKVRSEGFEAEINGQVMTGLQLSASYTYTRSRYLENPDDVSLEGRSFLTQMPAHAARVWANFTLPDEFAKWQVGVGTRIQSGTYMLGSGVKHEGSGYALYNGRIAYDISKNVNLSMNIENIFDRVYYAQTGPVESQNYYGAPRNMTFTLRTSF